MKKLNFRTMFCCVLLFGLGYLTCLALPTAEADMDRPEVSEIVADRIIARQSLQSEGIIGFVNGAHFWEKGAGIHCNGALEVGGNILASSYVDTATGFRVTGITVLDYNRVLQNVYITDSITGGNSPYCLRQCPEEEPLPLE